MLFSRPVADTELDEYAIRFADAPEDLADRAILAALRKHLMLESGEPSRIRSSAAAAAARASTARDAMCASGERRASERIDDTSEPT